MKPVKDLISVRGYSGITPTGWDLKVESEQQWITAGEVLKEIEKASQWWLGDWFNLCEWGDGREACDLIGIKYENARVCGHVARKFKLLRRRNNLSFSHHREVCRVKDNVTQDALLDWATGEKATVRELRYKVRDHLMIDVTPIREKMKIETAPEIKEVLEKAAEIIQEKKDEIWQDDLKELVDTVADNVKGSEASVVLSRASSVYAQSYSQNIRPKIPRQKSDVEKMVNTFHSFLRQLEKVKASGHRNLSENDRRMMSEEFKLMVPKALRLFDWMGIDLQRIVTNYVNRFKEVDHVQPNTERLVGD